MGSYRRTIAAAIATILTSVALYPVFTGSLWFWAGAGSTVIVALAGTLTRLRRLPLVICLAGGVLALALYLNAVFEARSSLVWVIPTPTSLRHLWDLGGIGFNESARYAPPVPELSGMVLLAAAGIGLCALFTDLIAVRLNSAAFAGVPLLLVFTEPFTLSVSRGWVGTTAVFCLAATGYLAMLSTEGRERIREWEQRRPSPAVAPDTRALAAAGRRVGITSVLVALCVPMLLPGLHVTRLFGSGSPGIGGTPGTGGVGFPSPQTQLSTELHESKAVPVLQYTSTDQTPGYLQVYVLSNLTTSGWQLSEPESLVSASPQLPVAPGLSQTATKLPVTTDVTVAKSVAQDELLALPAPYPAVRVHSPQGSLQADPSTLMVLDVGAQLGGLRYSVTSFDVDADASALATAPAPPADIRKDLEVPASYDSLRSLAQSITANATTPYAKAIALQNWLAGGDFVYTLNAPTITNASGLTSFLETTHSGYCQQFSFAMAALARLVGIPSQVAYGFTQGTSEKNGTWLVTTHDAHAWPELYFQGFGWLRFEPTPAGADGQGTATPPVYAQQHTTATGPISSVPTAPAPSPRASNAAGNNAGLGRVKEALAEGGFGEGSQAPVAAKGVNPWELAGFSLLALLVVLAALPVLVRAVIRRRRWRAGARAGDAGLAQAAWLELRDDLMDYGAGYVPSESPRGLAERVTRELGLTAADDEAAAGLRRVTMAAERARYSAQAASGVTLREDSAAIRRAIIAAAPRRARWRARLFPSSVVSPAALTVSQVTDVFGRLNRDRVDRVDRDRDRDRDGLPGGHKLPGADKRHEVTSGV
jgi:transglutaminase-like putative cysteine protease